MNINSKPRNLLSFAVKNIKGRKRHIAGVQVLAGLAISIFGTPAQAVTFCGPNPCAAVPAPGSGYIYSIPGGYKVYSAPNSVTFPQSPGFTYGALDFGPAPSVTARAAVGTATTPGQQYGEVTSSIFYSFMVVATEPVAASSIVPISINGEYALDAGRTLINGSSATADLVLSITSPTTTFQTVSLNKSVLVVGNTGCSATLNTCHRQEGGTYSFSRAVLVGTTFNVSMTAHSYAQQANGLTANYSRAYSYLDPIFSVDSSFADYSKYKIVLSAGFGNTASPVPELPPMSMFLFGALILSLAGNNNDLLFRKRRNRSKP
ncbi:MAG: hypothetical protein HY020_03915 [Burkholderiales bacterium]|nr:hypothetical protein [Burkholderiales bacterium]